MFWQLKHKSVNDGMTDCQFMVLKEGKTNLWVTEGSVVDERRTYGKVIDYFIYKER